MQKQARIHALIGALLIASAVTALPACSSPPALPQVDGSAPDKPINTPEAAEELKRKYQK